MLVRGKASYRMKLCFNLPGEHYSIYGLFMGSFQKLQTESFDIQQINLIQIGSNIIFEGVNFHQRAYRPIYFSSF